MSRGVNEGIRASLERQRDALLIEVSEADSHPRTALGYSNHQADDGTEAFDQATDLAMRCDAAWMLREVEGALARLADGTYGICRCCGEQIDPARLKAIPYTHCCLKCADHQQGV